MDKHELTKLLNSVADGSLPPEEAALKLKMEPFHEVGDYAKVDLHRGIRQGVPEMKQMAGGGKNKGADPRDRKNNARFRTGDGLHHASDQRIRRVYKKRTAA